MKTSTTTVLRGLAMGFALLLVACGSDNVTVPQAQASPFTEASVAIKQTGEAPVKLVDGSVHFRLDDARLVQCSLTVHSAATTAQTVTVRGSLYDKAGKLIGDVSGGSLNVAPNSDTQVQLSGPTPNGVIASATFEVTAIPSATAVPGS